MMETKLRKVMNVVTPIMLVLLLVLNVFTLTRVRALEANAGDVTEDVAQEDDVVIGGEYTIKSTKQISDAYKSGDSSKLSEKDEETLEMAKAVLGKIITDGMSDYDKELAVYQWMTANIGFDDGSLEVIPDTDSDCANPYGVLKYHNAVCVGYATTFRLFMQMMSIDCMVVHNSERSHSWDLVKLDGHWYHTDIYSDSPDGNFSHFNISDDVMINSQDWNTDFFPAADGYEYNYTYRNRAKCKDVYSIPQQVRAAIDAKASFISLDFGTDISDDIYTIADNIMNQVENATIADGSYGVSLTWDWLAAGDENIFCIYLSYESDNDNPGGDPDITDDVQQKIDSAVKKAFGTSGEQIVVGNKE